MAIPEEGVGDCLVADGGESLCVACGWLIFQMLPCFFPLEVRALCTRGARAAAG